MQAGTEGPGEGWAGHEGVRGQGWVQLEVRGQVRTAQGTRQGRPVRAGRGCGMESVQRWVARVVWGQK